MKKTTKPTTGSSHKKTPARKTLYFEVDPTQGFAAMAVGINLKGYRLLKIERQGRKAKAIFEKLPAGNGKSVPAKKK